MKHYASPKFWESNGRLTRTVQRLADKNFRLLKTDPHHPSLALKKAGKYYSARVGVRFRALAVTSGIDFV